MPRIRTLLAPLAFALLAIAPPAAAQTDIGNMTPEERAAFGAEVRAYLMANPEVLNEVIEELVRRREEAQAEADRQVIAENADALFDDGYSWVGGNPEGDVTVVEFLDYNCPYCKQAHPEVAQLLEEDPNIRFVVKEFPILSPGSVAAAEVALAALEQDAELFPALHEALMTHQGKVDGPSAYRIAEAVGYDVETLEETAQEREIAERIGETYQLAQRLGIDGTPGFVIGEQVFRGFIPAEELAAAVEAARAPASN